MPTEITTTFTRLNPQNLKPHPRHIDSDEIDADFLESCKAGIIQPLVVTLQNQIVSGRRRWKAANQLGLKEVPVIVRLDLKDELDIREAIIRANDQRARTNEEKARAFAILKEIAAERAAKRQKATQPAAGEQVGSKDRANLPTPKKQAENAENGKTGRAGEEAAEAVGMSRRTAERATTVVNRIDELAADGKPEEAAELRETLNKKSVNAAHKKATEVPKAEANGKLADAETRMKEWNTAVESFARKITAIINEAPEGPWMDETRRNIIMDQLKSAAGTARQAKGHAVTPKGVNWDRGTGFAPKQAHDMNSAVR